MTLLFAAAGVFAQVNVTSVTGTVTDPTGAAVPGAKVLATSADTGAKFNATTDDKGLYAIPSMPAGAYNIAVTKTGFKIANVQKVGLAVGIPGTVNVKLEIGQASETVEVTAGAEIVQATTADVTTNLTGRQLNELPFATRNAIELLVDAPGTQTPTNPRSSTINGLPKGALNVTIDGMNTQDNNLKSSDGYFSYIYPSVDALEEVTMTTSAAGVDSTSQGGAQIKFITKSGTNTWHGGGFWQVRNTFFNANSYFNNQLGLARSIVKLNQYGGHVGGPILKNKLFFFGNFEAFRNPTSAAFSRTYLTPSAASGVYTYVDAAGGTHQINTLQVAAANQAPAGTRAFSSTLDPLLAKTYALAQQFGANGVVKTNQSSNDYNTLTTTYQPGGLDSRHFYTSRIDYNVTSKHTLSFVYNYDAYTTAPDILNSVVPIYPGTGTVLGSSLNAGQRSNRFDGTISLRSVLTSNITNEFRAGLNGGTVLFRDTVSPALFSPWRGYVPSFASPGTALSGVTTTSSPQRRNAPVKDIADTVTLVHGAHQFSFGGNFDQINLFQSVNGSAVFPTIAFGIATGDPALTGSGAIFTTANFPGATSTQLSQAANVYADVTGRVSSIGTGVILNELTHQYGAAPTVDRDRMREFGLFVQDQWRIRPTLTATIGFRLEKQTSFVNLNGLYSQVTYPELWGLSGVGNLFQPGTLTGVSPTFTKIAGNGYDPAAVPAPSIGLAWQAPVVEGMKWLTGNRTGALVVRGGYSIATVREGMNVYTSLYGSNQGISLDGSISPTTYPALFPLGSSLFSDASLPSRISTLPTTPNFPIPASFTTSLNGFDPKLGMGYVQSWNISLQRELNKDTVLELRYTGNHGTKLWRQVNLNEVNIFENGFLKEFQIAQNNLAINRGGNIANPSTAATAANYNNFGNLGLPGQQAVPILSTALGTTSDSTSATNLMLGQVGTLASSISTNSGRMANLTNAKYPANFFVVNPTVGSGGSFVLNNSGGSYYDGFTAELRRRLAGGLTAQGSYTFAKALVIGAQNSAIDSSQPFTLRNTSLDKQPEGFDIRHAVKFNWIYELPFGRGRHFLSSAHNVVLRKAVEGWQLTGVARLQSGTPISLSSYATYNSSANGGVVLHNITLSQLQSEVGVYKTSLQGANGGIIYYLPPANLAVDSKNPALPTTSGLTSSTNNNLITNTQAAFGVSSLLPSQVNPNVPYISPAAAGQFGCHCFLYLPWQRHFDVTLQKNVQITERVNMTFRATALNVFNLTNFLPGSNTTSATFGQITSAYSDISGSSDPGSRIIEFQARINF
jgi:hypothetical protein